MPGRQRDDIADVNPGNSKRARHECASCSCLNTMLYWTEREALSSAVGHLCWPSFMGRVTERCIVQASQRCHFEDQITQFHGTAQSPEKQCARERERVNLDLIKRRITFCAVRHILCFPSFPSIWLTWLRLAVQTYIDAEIKCGQRLNLVLGPNGQYLLPKACFTRQSPVGMWSQLIRARSWWGWPILIGPES